MSSRRGTCVVRNTGLTLLALVAPCLAGAVWNVRSVTVELRLDPAAMRALGLGVHRDFDSQFLDVSTPDDLSFSTDQGHIDEIVVGELKTSQEVTIHLGSERVLVASVRVVGESTADQRTTIRSGYETGFDREPGLELSLLKAGANPTRGSVTLIGGDLRISRETAAALGDPALAGRRIGTAMIRGQAYVDGGQPDVGSPMRDFDAVSPRARNAPAGPDVAFCELFGMEQQGRVGDTVGLAIATTSWNVGTADAMWFAIPNEEHPFIAQNLYRLEDDRLMQIGQSWLKHAFFALDDEQCGTACTFEPGHSQGNWLGVGCTDTYVSFLNGQQTNLGPRYEVNPWTAAFTFAGSHIATTAGDNHNAIDHRLQVRDDDLDRAGAIFIEEGYYLVQNDINHMNNAAWKPVSVSGVPLGTWFFNDGGSGNHPNAGFALDAWLPFEQQVMIAQEPPVPGESPDGACMLGAKTTDMGGGVWHYEYALYNVDMDRKVRSFSLPLRLSTVVSNVGFYAVPSHGEPFSNGPWTASITTDAITWSTTDNPLRWGTMYNYWFDADAPPFPTTVTVELFEPGTPGSLTASVIGPKSFGCPVANAALPEPVTTKRSRYLQIDPSSNPGVPTAVRVRFRALLESETNPTIDGFEGDARWLGPPQEFLDIDGTFMASALQCQPFFMDWTTVGFVNVYGAGIIPNSTYEIQTVDQLCEGELDNEGTFSGSILVTTGAFGDIVPPYVGDPGAVEPSFFDIGAAVAAFQLKPGAPNKTVAQQQPNVPVPSNAASFSDISNVVVGFKKAPYPFAGPTACP